MSDLLKSVIQDLINDRTEQAQVSIHQYIVTKTQEVAGLQEAKSSYTSDEIKQGIEDMVLAFASKADKFMPDAMEWEEELIDQFGDNPELSVFRDEAKHFFGDFYPRYAAGDRKLMKFLVANHEDAVLDAIAAQMKNNFSLR
jgi:hypothetical protein